MSPNLDSTESLRAAAETSLRRIMDGVELRAPEAEALMGAVVAGLLEEVQVAALLTALEMRGPGASELSGFGAALLARMIPVPETPVGTMDTCGTGGSQKPTLNTSTLAGLVAAACGAYVAKHGNRSASGRCGSLDVLEALGAETDLDPATTSRLLKKHRFAFVNARSHHPVLARVARVRKQLGFRTVFNLLGPILSPARVQRQLLGVSSAAAGPVLAQALAQMGRERAWVVSGPDGLDEIALSETTAVWAVEGGRVRAFALEPRVLRLEPAPFAALTGGSVAENRRRFEALLSGEDRGAARDHVALNAAAALVVADVAQDLADGLAMARAALEDGHVLRLFTAWREDTRAAGKPETREDAPEAPGPEMPNPSKDELR